ncbi:MAG: hypothetical protein LBH98_05150 [Chitinispirillales bacterium]|jgi:hypothetical protein|nr:hypothetical protein [Chitinispirillales bacterium]
MILSLDIEMTRSSAGGQIIFDSPLMKSDVPEVNFLLSHLKTAPKFENGTYKCEIVDTTEENSNIQFNFEQGKVMFPSLLKIKALGRELRYNTTEKYETVKGSLKDLLYEFNTWVWSGTYLLPPTGDKLKFIQSGMSFDEMSNSFFFTELNQGLGYRFPKRPGEVIVSVKFMKFGQTYLTKQVSHVRLGANEDDKLYAELTDEERRGGIMNKENLKNLYAAWDATRQNLMARVKEGSAQIKDMKELFQNGYESVSKLYGTKASAPKISISNRFKYKKFNEKRNIIRG